MLQGGLCALQRLSQEVLFVPLQFPVKMRINQGYLLVLLLASLSASCTSDCKTTSYDKCAKLYNILEAALLKNQGNLYQLHDSFFPSSSSEPIYAGVTYNLNGGCDYDYDYDRCYSTCWTSSILLRSVDPVVLTGLQVQLLNTLLKTVGVSDLTADYSYGAQLSLELNVTEFNYLNHITILQELTQWVSA